MRVLPAACGFLCPLRAWQSAGEAGEVLTWEGRGGANRDRTFRGERFGSEGGAGRAGRAAEAPGQRLQGGRV